MRKVATGLLLGALLVVIARLFTGVDYRADEPTAALVVKRRPAWAIERTETPTRPVEEDIVIDRDEPGLAYGPLYLGAMRAAPVAALLMAIAGASMLRRNPRRH